MDVYNKKTASVMAAELMGSEMFIREYLHLKKKEKRKAIDQQFFFFQAEDGIRDRSPSRGLGDVYKRQADNSAAAAAGEVWKCTQTLNTPSGYSGGPVRLELIQNVNGTPTASVVLEDQVIQFPYDLDITGAPGISEGTLYLSEQISGTYQELGNYSITFAKAE